MYTKTEFLDNLFIHYFNGNHSHVGNELRKSAYSISDFVEYYATNFDVTVEDVVSLVRRISVYIER